ncbi:M16 family metallopeptidase [Aureibacter tunicatorum]|uniref:Zn-dependent peptidase n=1 Tax=Aureibacter tunicatorum TaxID=866807 RepID=A0AAE4BQQ5_9BACT|nr:insulinase family protein [Aureibacter tunicatorum]MDR6239409.1 putative Zn-dependent peptidase [Aureibacter tunicatorum]BDD04668.1 peptidase M16 [Aureibacter tunicatorum]
MISKNRTKWWNFTILLLILCFYGCKSNSNETDNEYKHNFKTVDNDPYGALIYKLDNGLKVYLSVNKKEPRIQTYIAVNTGSKQDPSDATGLAHYLEHMLFKGTSKIGALDWKDEKPYLDKIENLYEERRSTTDKQERAKIYESIDSLSYIASGFVATNEYDKIISELGASGTNAYTSLERTVYINEIPSNELDKWLQVESERFKEVVLRLFHTELEAVYEEFNRSLDNDNSQAYYTVMKSLFKNHPYGTQTTIGTAEDLKNPSMKKIYEYFDQYYAANNMAIILSGDLDPDATVDLIEKYFGGYPVKEVPEFTFTPEQPMVKPVETILTGPSSSFVEIGYRLPGSDSARAALKLELLSYMLYNGQAGLLDLNVNQKQKVLTSYVFPMINKDYSVFFMYGKPRDGQSLKQVQELMQEQIDKVKKGEFEDWLMEACVKNIKLEIMQSTESNSSRGNAFVDAFIKQQNWEDVVSHINELDKITKNDIIEFANKYFNENYAVVYKEQGANKKEKFQKPKITPIQVNRDAQSAFFAHIDSISAGRLQPEFLDYKKLIAEASLGTNGEIPFSYIENKSNGLFSLNYILDMGAYNDPELALAVTYLSYLGTEKYSAADLQREFFKLGLSFGVNSSDERVYVTLSGLEESLEPGIKLFEEILETVVPDQQAYDNLVNDILKARYDQTLDKSQILRVGLAQFAKYGEDSPVKYHIPESKLKSLKPELLIEKIKSLTSYKHRIFYYGQLPMNAAKKAIEQYHKVDTNLKSYPAKKMFDEMPTDKNMVYYVDYDMAQTEILMLSRGQEFDVELLAPSSLFNQYFGAGLSSVVFQEIRESKALAYSTYSYYANAAEKGKHNYVIAYIGTQVDKLPEATSAMLSLMNEMPQAQIQFDAAKTSALKSIESNRVVGPAIFWSYEAAKKRGIDYDINEKIYTELKNIDLNHINQFFQNNIKGNKYDFLVIGPKDKMDFASLQELGTFKELSIKDIFGYDSKSLKQ